MRRFIWNARFAFAIVITLWALQPVGAQTTAPLVSIDTGRLEGIVEDQVTIFRGIPYAQPPVRELRWRPPQPKSSRNPTPKNFKSRTHTASGTGSAPYSS